MPPWPSLIVYVIASVPANMEGKLMKPRIEMDQPPQAFDQPRRALNRVR